MATVLLDTGVWYCLCDEKDRTRTQEQIGEIQGRIAAHNVVVPWPVVYETLRTRFVRNTLALTRFEWMLKSPRMCLMDDSMYRKEALNHSIASSLHRQRPLSLVDCLLRIFMDDVNTKVHYFVTFNVVDFADVCRKRRIEVLS